MKSDLDAEKKRAIKIANELLYSKKIKDKILKAKSDSEIYRILATARNTEIRD